MIMLIDELSKTMQMGKQTDLILLDFSKGFDKVAHEKTHPKVASLWYQRRRAEQEVSSGHKQSKFKLHTCLLCCVSIHYPELVKFLVYWVS